MENSYSNRIYCLQGQCADMKSEAATRFLLVVLKFNKRLSSWLPENFVFEIWCSHWHIVEDTVLEALLKVASVDQYDEMLQVLLAHTVSKIFRKIIFIIWDERDFF